MKEVGQGEVKPRAGRQLPIDAENNWASQNTCLKYPEVYFNIVNNKGEVAGGIFEKGNVLINFNLF